MSHLFQYVDCRILYHCVTSLGKNYFLKCCIFGESHQILVMRVLIFGSSPHSVGKYILCSVYCWSLAKFTAKIDLWTVNPFPIQSFKFIHFVSSFIHFACLALIVLVLMVGKADGQDFFLKKQLVSIFFCSITCFWVHNSEYKHLIPCYWTELVILFWKAQAKR